jgi:ClpP class serine protease
MYSHILTRLINTPLLITADKLEILTSEVGLKLLAGNTIDRSVATPDNPTTASPVSIGVIPVYGSLVNKNGAGSSGVTSYQGTKASILEAVNSGIKHLVFDVSSPGGEAAGAFPLADFINKLPAKYGIQTYGFTDSQAASGGYIILGACQQVFATDIADVGSIGAVMSLVDVTKMDAEEGIKYTILRSKEDKAAYNPHEVASEKVIQDLQAKLQVLDTKFNTSMVKYRNGKLSIETVMNLAGKTVTATEGVSLGLVDSIVTSIEDVFSEILVNKPVDKAMNINHRSTTMSEVTLETFVALQAENTSLKEAQSLAVATAVQNERLRCANIMSSGTTFAVSSEMVVKAISKGWALEMVADCFSELATKNDADTAIATGASSLTSADAVQKAALLAAQQTDSFTAEIDAGIVAAKSEQKLFNGVG